MMQSLIRGLIEAFNYTVVKSIFVYTFVLTQAILTSFFMGHSSAVLLCVTPAFCNRHCVLLSILALFLHISTLSSSYLSSTLITADLQRTIVGCNLVGLDFCLFCDRAL